MSNRWTEQQYRDYIARQLKSHERTRQQIQDRAQPAGLPAAVAKQDARETLVSVANGTPTRNPGTAKRFKVSFIVRSRRPCDWDNLATTKFLQDGLVDAGIIPSDSWDTISGQIISEKADSEADEGTTIIVEQL